MKLVSWNVNGLRAVVGKGFADIFESFDADCVCLQETKLKAGQIDLEFPGYESYWDYADKPGYAGTAIYTRRHPLSVRTGIGIDEHDHEGRAVTLEFGDFFLVNAYVPNSQNELKRLDYRMRWEDDFRAYQDSRTDQACGGLRRYECCPRGNRPQEPRCQSFQRRIL